MIRFAFLAVGMMFLIGLVWHIGPSQIWETTERVGIGPFCIILLPLLVVYLLDTYGWCLTLGHWVSRIGFLRLFMVRMAGEAINVTTPTAMLGGEPMKAYLLKRDGVPMVEGLASVVAAKTIMVIAQMLFMLLGLGLMVWTVGEGEYDVLGAFVSVGLLGFGVFLLLIVQRYGIGAGLLTVAETCRIRRQWVEARRSQFLELDRTLRRFYHQRRQTFVVALCVFFIAWLTECLEVYAILYFLGAEVGWLSSLSIAAIAVLIKGSVSFIPGGMGAQEGGYLFLLMGFGYGEVTGLTFALLRRMREIIWILIGLIFLAALRGRTALASTA